MAYIAALSSDYCLSKRAIRRLLGDMYRLSISISTVKRAENTVNEALSTYTDEAAAYVRQQAGVNSDETSTEQEGKRHWVWAAIGGGEVTLCEWGSP